MEQTDVPLNEIKDVLVKLARGDLLEYMRFGDWFGKINDPIVCHSNTVYIRR